VSLRSLFKAATPQPQTACLTVEGREVQVRFRENARARRIILRFDKSGDGLILTLPRRTSRSRALSFAQSQIGWIAERLTRQPARREFADGMCFPFRGTEIKIARVVGARAVTRLEDGLLKVGGAEAHVVRRTLEWLKKEAKRELQRASDEYAQKMGVRYSRLTLRDTQSRWGSCSASGALSYSWRLILAPDEVLDYVCAHEVAHLKQMNHGPKFWALVAAHCPHMERARDWLKKDGSHLHLIG
jgi:predicted metal-dependent hydrolase